MKAWTLLLTLWPLSVAAQDTPDWWLGVWAWDPAFCVNKDRVGAATPAPIIITANEVLGYENSCAITSARDINESTIYLTLTCQSEGSDYDDDRVIMRGADGIWIWYGYDAPAHYTSCE